MIAISAFFTGWFRVLRDSLPEGLQRILGLVRRYTVITPEIGGFAVSLATGTKLSNTKQVDLTGLPNAVHTWNTPVVLHLPDTMVIRSSLTLPDSALRSLDQVIDVEIERLTPFRGADVHVARRIRHASSGQIHLDLTVVPRDRLDAVTRPLADMGIFSDHVVAGPDALRDPVANNLQGTPQRSARRRTSNWPSIVSVCLALVAVGSPFTAQEWRERELQKILAEIQPRADAVLQLATEVETLEARRVQRSDFDAKRIPVTLLINDVSRRLPDHAWIHRFSFGDDALILEGRSASATTLIGLLNASTFLSRTHFEAPISRDPASGSDRFIVSSDVVFSEAVVK